MPLLHYVILHHTGVDEPHFDVMIESSPVGQLTTWRIAEWPIVEPTAAIRLPDHRRAYLTYQGAISVNRGIVTQMESGETVVEFNGESEIILHRQAGALRIEHVRDNDWMIAPTSTSRF